MTVRYLGWRAGALAVVGCALGALLASPPAQAQTCVGDCNGDGVVLVNEIITGVNIALDAAPISACPSFDVNGDGKVTINELIVAVNNALNGCPVVPTFTATEIDTPTSTPTLPAGTATATITNTIPIVINTATATATTGEGSPTPTATEAPAEELGENTCTLADGSDLFLQTAAPALHLAPHGSYSIDCGTPDADGVAACSCELIQLDVLVIPAIGDVCINPAPGCEAGKIDCDGGAAVDVNLTADHNIGTCTDNEDCATSCEAHCTTLGAGHARQSYGCEGYCQGGSNDEAECSRDTDCPGGQCPGADPVAHFQTCNCVCAGSALGNPSVAGGLTCNLGTQINVELPSNGHCGDTATIQLAPVCGGVSTGTSIGAVLNANNMLGTTIPTTDPPSVIEGNPVTCDSFKAHNITGLKLVGQLGFFDSTLGDIRTGNTFICQ
jgi:hypothetical protein